MTSNLLTIMQNDSVAARLFSGYPYRRSLMGEKEEEAYDSAVDGMEDGLIINLYDFFYSIPIWFYVSLLVLLLLFILFRLYQSGFFERQWQIKANHYQRSCVLVTALEVHLVFVFCQHPAIQLLCCPDVRCYEFYVELRA